VARQARLRYGFNQVKGKMNGKPPLTWLNSACLKCPRSGAKEKQKTNYVIPRPIEKYSTQNKPSPGMVFCLVKYGLRRNEGRFAADGIGIRRKCPHV
jgi:hypothetical protein